MISDWLQLGMETTAKAADWREQMDLSTPHELRKDTDPMYYNLFGPNQWPSADLLPDFREVFETYMEKLSAISMDFTRLIAECLGLPATAFDQFFDENQYVCSLKAHCLTTLNGGVGSIN
jgi:isopenicillin N synthase-like dioxygenase